MNKSIISEALGVPEGIVQSAIVVYQKILEEIKLTRKSPKGMEIQVLLPKREVIKIGDKTFNTINVKINFHEHETMELAGMAFRNMIKFVDSRMILKFQQDNPKEINLSMEFTAPKNFKKKDFLDYLETNKNSFIPIIGHELKHGFDALKRKFYTPREHSLYAAKTSTYFDIPPIDTFIMSLYYIENVENLVRPSELATQLELGNIDKSKFLEFLQKSDIYNRLKKVNSFSFEEMKKDVYNYMPRIKEILASENIKVKNKDEAVELILRGVMITLGTKALTAYLNVVTVRPEEQIFAAYRPDKRKIMDKFHSEVMRFGDDYEAFFKYEEKRMKEVSEKLMKKLSKLYAYVKDTKPEDEKSIRNWELHHKISGTKDEGYQFEMKSLEELFKKR